MIKKFPSLFSVFSVFLLILGIIILAIVFSSSNIYFILGAILSFSGGGIIGGGIGIGMKLIKL